MVYVSDWLPLAVLLQSEVALQGQEGLAAVILKNAMGTEVQAPTGLLRILLLSLLLFGLRK